MAFTVPTTELSYTYPSKKHVLSISSKSYEFTIKILYISIFFGITKHNLPKILPVKKVEVFI